MSRVRDRGVSAGLVPAHLVPAVEDLRARALRGETGWYIVDARRRGRWLRRTYVVVAPVGVQDVLVVVGSAWTAGGASRAACGEHADLAGTGEGDTWRDVLVDALMMVGLTADTVGLILMALAPVTARVRVIDAVPAIVLAFLILIAEHS